MTDLTDVPPAPIDDDDHAGFYIVPGAEMFLRLERRVGELEQVRAELAAATERLQRHRAELELIKSRMVQLVEYVQQTAPAPTPTLNRSALL